MTGLQTIILELICKLGKLKVWSAVDLVEQGVNYQSSSIGMAMKGLVKFGFLEIVERPKGRKGKVRYKLTESGKNFLSTGTFG